MCFLDGRKRKGLAIFRYKFYIRQFIRLSTIVLISGCGIKFNIESPETQTDENLSTQSDTTSPTLLSVSGPANGSYSTAQDLDFIATFSEDVTVDTSGGTPRIQLTIGAATVYASYVSGTGTGALVFRYTVQAGDTDTNGIASTSPIDLNGGTIKDTINNAGLAFSAPNTTSVLVDTTAPSISSVTGPANGTYNLTQNLDFTVNFSENVNVVTTGGTPRIQLTIGSTTRYATYNSGTGTSALVFRYTTQAGDTDGDGIASTSPLQLNGGTILDAATNATSLTFSAPNTAGVKVQTAAPSSLSYSSGSPVSYPVGSSITNNVPTVTGIVDTYSVLPALPAGLSISASTGVISGTPTTMTAAADYTITAANTMGNTTAIVNIAITCPSPTAGTVAAVYPTNGAKWMDYVKNNNGGTNYYNQPDTACAGTENGYFACIHGGEKRKVATSLTSCTGLSATDSLGVFDWECKVLGGNATLVSKGLKSGKGLKDLISATAFTNNSVTVANSTSGCTEVTTTPGAWWSNTVSAIPASGGAGALSFGVSGTIYTVTNTVTGYGWNIAADKVAIVTLGASGELKAHASIAANCSYPAGAVGGGDWKALVCAGTRKFNWIEGKFNGNSNSQGVFFTSGTTTSFVRIQNSEFYKFTPSMDGGINAYGAKSFFFNNVLSFSNDGGGNDGLGMGLGINYSTFNNIVITNVSGWAISLGASTASTNANNLFINVTLSNSSGGLMLGQYSTSTSDNTFIGITSSSSWYPIDVYTSTADTQSTYNLISSINGYSGMYSGDHYPTVTKLTLSNALFINNASHGMHSNYTSNSRFYDIAAGMDGYRDGSGYGINNDASTGNQFFGRLIIGNNNTGDCQVTGTPVGTLLDNSCNHGTGLAITPISLSQADIAGAIVGKVTSDSSNTTHTGGQQAASALGLDGHFDNLYRTWGKGATATAFPDYTESVQSPCFAGTCQLWDYRLKATDTVFRNIHGAFINGGACPASVAGNVAANIITDQQTSPRTYLMNAYEIIADQIGNENGLCESNEACIYAPNMGAYQGEGDYKTRTCTFTDGTISGVIMYAYPTNGI